MRDGLWGVESGGGWPLMTAGQRHAVVTFGSIVKEWSAPAGGLIVFVYFGWGLITGIAGPIKMGTQVDLASLGSRVTALEMAQKAFETAQAATVDEIRNTKTAIIDRINSMPRLTDYSDQRDHLARLDERMNKVEVAQGELGQKAGGIETRVSTLEGRQPYRNPTGGH